jgi:hypothetical protein
MCRPPIRPPKSERAASLPGSGPEFEKSEQQQRRYQIGIDLQILLLALSSFGFPIFCIAASFIWGATR